MKRALLAVGVVAAIGIVYFALLRRSSDDEAPKPADKPDRAAHAAVAKPAADRSGDRAGFDVPILADDDPPGKLRLEGIVVDAANNPVAGAVVTLSSQPPRTKTSEADGGFYFDNLVAKPYTLVARATAGVAGPVTARLTDKTELVTLRIRPGSKVTVDVTGIDGKPAEGATVELRGLEELHEVTSSGKASFANVAPGGYQLVGWATGTARTHQWLTVGSGDTTAKLVLVAGAPVSGKVVDERGAAVSGARVIYSGASDWSQQAMRHDAATTGTDGAFRFDALPAGSFRFVASAPEGNGSLAPGTSALVTLDGKHERTGVQIAMTDGATVRGRVADSAGNPVASARVRVGIASKNVLFDPPRQAYSDDKGGFELKGLPKKPLVAVAIHESGASHDVQVDATRGDPPSVELVIDVTGIIAGVVVDPAGQPLEGMQVSAGPNFGSQRGGGDFQQWRLRGFPQELTDGTGHFTLTGLAPGSYTISAAPAHSAAQAFVRGMGETGTVAETGQKDLRLVVAPEGAVRGKVAFTDGTLPQLFTIQIGMNQQSFMAGDGSFELDGLPPQRYELQVRGPQFQTRAVEVVVESGKTADAGTVQVVAGRGVGGIVTYNGQPVPNATVYAGRVIFGNGTSNSAQFGPMGQGAKTTTTGADGTFSLSGFADGDLAITAEEPTIGRSKALRLPTEMPGQTELTLELQAFGSLSGVLRQGGKPAEGVFVTSQSTTTPGALYAVASGPDGAYRFDRLAPDTYKVSATVGMPLVGMKFYSQQIDVPMGAAVTLDLTADGGAVSLDVTAAPRSGTLGVATVWLASGSVSATTATDLGLKLAALGQSASQLVIIRSGEPAHFADLTSGAYSACVVPFPTQVQGMAAQGYAERHGDKLPAYCKPVAVADSPPSQAASVPVEIPPFIPDQGSGSGSGSSGSASK